MATYAIIIVTYNSGGDILPCLQALCRATPAKTAQLIIVDNASTDDTRHQLEHFRQSAGAHFAAINLIENRQNRGFTTALNQGLRSARAPYLLLLNPDTVLSAAALPRLRTSLQRQGGAGVIAPQLRNSDGSVQPSCRRFPTHLDVLWITTGLAALFPRSRRFNRWKMGDFDHRQSRDVDQPQGACLFTSREIVERIGHWDEAFPMFFSDVDWCYRVRQAGYRIWFDADISVLHHQGRSVFQRRPAMILSSHRSFITYFLKHFRGFRWLLPNIFVIFLLSIGAAARFVLATLGQHRGNTPESGKART